MSNEQVGPTEQYGPIRHQIISPYSYDEDEPPYYHNQVELQENAEPHYCQQLAPLRCFGCADCQNGFVANPRCRCGQMARWYSSGANETYRYKYYCYNCISRGCSCNQYLADEGRRTQRYVDAQPCVEIDPFRPPMRLRGKRKAQRRKYENLRS